MAKIEIETENDYYEYVADELRHIASLIDEGYTSGYFPTWSVEGITEENKEDEE